MKSKVQVFPEPMNELAGFAKAMSHPARIAIVTLLMERGRLCCGEIVSVIPLAQATVSQHLRELIGAELLIAENCGQKVCYELDRTRIKNFCHAFQQALGNNLNAAAETSETGSAIKEPCVSQ